ncbi:hypothetical protein WDU94_006338, partial [Cyamophila willieti]
MDPTMSNGVEGGFSLSSADMMDIGLISDKPPPPQYEVATQYLKNKQAQESHQNNILLSSIKLEAQPGIKLESMSQLNNNLVSNIKLEAQHTIKLEPQQQNVKVKSQLLDDIIDILIKNGDVSPSAADPNAQPSLRATAPSYTKPGNVFNSCTTVPTSSDEHQIDLHSLGLDMEQFPMDLGDDVTAGSPAHPPVSTNEDVELMDVDTDWLEKFISDDPILSPAPSNQNSILSNQSGVLSNQEYDPLLSNNSNSFWN